MLILLSMLQRRKLDTRTVYRSVRYRLNRGDAARTADPSSNNFRIKRNSCLESTLYRTNDSAPTQNSIDLGLRELARTDYLKSFNSMMEKSERVPRQKLAKLHVSFFEDARISLPDFENSEKEVEDSHHSLLTPFHQPYSHVKLLYASASSELKSQQNICNEVRAGLRKIKDERLRALEGLTSQAQEQFAKIRSILRKDEISQQEKKLKTRRQLSELQKQHKQNVGKFSELSDKSSGLQVVIFNSTPFDLKERDSLGEVYI